jgi:hypothetical protein
MPSYYEELPIYKAAMDVAVRLEQVVMLEEPEPCGNIKRRRLAYVFERLFEAERRREESE